jgi:hypothetical protein
MTRITAFCHQGESRSFSSDWVFIVIALVDDAAEWSKDHSTASECLTFLRGKIAEQDRAAL